MFRKLLLWGVAAWSVTVFADYTYVHMIEQTEGGDFNGKLDNTDYQALRQLLKDKGVI